MEDAASLDWKIIKVLMIDDSETDCAIFRRYLLQDKEQRFDFIAAPTIAEAFRLLAEEEPDCLLLDYDLPDGTGVQMLERVVAERGKNAVPVVMLSGSASVSTAVAAMRLGAQDFLIKNHAGAAEVIRAVQNAIDKVMLYSERETAAQRMRLSEERYRLLFENTPLPALVFDLQTRLILTANDCALTHYGFTREEFARLRFDDLDACAGASSEIVQGESGDEPTRRRGLPAQQSKKDGTVIDVEVSCHDIVFQGRKARFAIVQDVTERNLAYAQIRQSEEFNRTIIESSPDCVNLLDGAGRLQFVNANGLRLMEIDDFERIRGAAWEDMWAPECRELVRQAVEAAKTGQIGRFQGNCRTSKGNPRWWDVIVTPVRDARGKVERILSVARDITASKHIEHEREEILRRETELRRQAESANRAKDEFLAVLSHELRTPLNAMFGWAKMLREGNLTEVLRQKAVTTIERNVRLQTALIEDLLDVSRIITGKIRLEPKRVDICKVVRETIEAARHAAQEKNIIIESRLPTEEAYGVADSIRLQQIVSNLLTNAIKFTPENGQVALGLVTEGQNARIIVSDTGVGIEPELLPHIFDRFWQADGSTKRKFGGLGLGLAIAKSLTEMHGGRLSARSAGVGQGTTFTVELPIMCDKTAHGNWHQATPGRTRVKDQLLLRNIRVMLVEDQPDSLELLKFVMEEQGARVSAYTCAAEALANLETDNPDVLISDISMAEMDGYDLLREIRHHPFSRNKFIPAAAMTAYASADDRAAVLSAGFQSHIAKPVDIDSVAHQIRTLLEAA